MVSSSHRHPRQAAIRYAIFDLDGTLTDPFVGITRCLQHALGEMGVPAPPASSLSGCIGPPIRDTFASLLGTSDRSQIELALSHYRARYGEIGLLENRLYDGVPALLETLRTRGFTLYVATSKLESYARRIIGHFGLGDRFAGVFGARMDGRFDDKVELLAWLLETEKLEPSACVMIGDRRFDVEAGRRTGCTTVGITYGYGDREELENAGAHSICDSPAEILTLPLFQPDWS